MGYSLTLREKKFLADNTYEFSFRKPEGFLFQAGQHMELEIAGESRSLSICSAPEEEDLKFAVRHSESSFKNALLNMNFGDAISAEGPYGDFTLHLDTEAPAVFLIGGIGITLARSIIISSLKKDLPHKLYLFYSNQSIGSAPYLKELSDLAQDDERLKIIPVITGLTDEGEKGQRIDEAMIKSEAPQSEKTFYYLSGKPEMVHSMKVLLDKMSVDDERVKSEEFSGY